MVGVDRRSEAGDDSGGGLNRRGGRGYGSGDQAEGQQRAGEKPTGPTGVAEADLMFFMESSRMASWRLEPASVIAAVTGERDGCAEHGSS
jgi:hypothetical protein